MPDIGDLILDDHEVFRRRFAELDEHRDDPADRLSPLWGPLAELLDRHADAEERLFYPLLLDHGVRAVDETKDAIGDHNDIRDAVRDARGAEVGSDQWWQAVTRARTANSEHMGEEERGALADFRSHVAADARAEAGDRWVAFNQDHAGARAVDTDDKDPAGYVERNR